MYKQVKLRGTVGRSSMLLVALVAGVVAIHGSLLAGDGVVTLKNGDRISGDIKKLQNGELQIKPSYGENTFLVDWSDIEKIESAALFVFETAAGRRVTGSLRTDPQQPGQLLLGTELTVDPSQLVALNPVEERFWERLDVALDFGFNFAKANDARQLNLRASSGYLAEQWQARVQWNTLQSLSGVEGSSDRWDLGASYRRFLTDRWFAEGFTDFLQSDELRLDLRSTTGGAVGSYLVRNQRWYLAVSGGAAWTNEQFLDPANPRVNSGEGLGTFELNIFDVGNLDFGTEFSILPSLSQAGRVRMNLSTDVRWELISDLYFNLGFTDNFDSSPVGDTPRNDYAVTTSIGWTY
ncbi:MAG: DUF481 domain-containing protein [Acidobacteriota bacterium]